LKRILLIGCGGHAKSIIDILENNSDWKLFGLIGLKNEVGKKVLDFPIVGNDNDLPKFRKEFDYAFLSIGQIGLSKKRKMMANYLEELNYTFPTLKSKFSIVSKYSSIDYGTLICHNSIINSNTKIGKHCIINSKSLIEHDVVIGDFCHVSTGAIVNGGVSIGEGSFIGSGSIIREGVIIPPNTIISAGKRIMGWPNRD
jgi:sugar O-acyltransferase (sialic acid O-acetyltransferase NeuD family)